MTRAPDTTQPKRSRAFRERRKARIALLEAALCAIATQARTINEARAIADEALVRRPELRNVE